MNIIAATDKNMGIGYQGRLLVTIPQDQQFFREETMGKVIVLGHKTLETFPNGLPLAGRTNIILSANPNFKVRGGIVVHSVEEALETLKNYSDDDIYIVGGESIYKEFLPYCNTIHLTSIDYEYVADRHFPAIDPKEWKLTADSEEQTYFNLEYYFYRYDRIHPVQRDITSKE